MRTRMWMAAGACAVALAGAVASAGPAFAKGIQSATISGPGLEDPIDVAPANGDGGRLATLTGFWDAMPGQPRPPTFTEQAPAGRLGARYTIAWRLMTGPGETTLIRQDLYPDAAGGPLVHTSAGQPIFDGTTVDGWYAAPFALRDVLMSLGVPAADSQAVAVTSPAATPHGARAPSAGDSPWPTVIIAASAVLALAGVGGAVAVRRARRRDRVAPVPL